MGAELELFVAYFDRIPIFASEGILCSLFEPFLPLGKALVPTRDDYVNMSSSTGESAWQRRTLTFQQP